MCSDRGCSAAVSWHRNGCFWQRKPTVTTAARGRTTRGPARASTCAPGRDRCCRATPDAPRTTVRREYPRPASRSADSTDVHTSAERWTTNRCSAPVRARRQSGAPAARCGAPASCAPASSRHGHETWRQVRQPRTKPGPTGQVSGCGRCDRLTAASSVKRSRRIARETAGRSGCPCAAATRYQWPGRCRAPPVPRLPDPPPRKYSTGAIPEPDFSRRPPARAKIASPPGPTTTTASACHYRTARMLHARTAAFRVAATATRPQVRAAHTGVSASDRKAPGRKAHHQSDSAAGPCPV